MQLAVHFSLQDGLAQGLRLRAQQRGPESIAREGFLRHLWMAERTDAIREAAPEAAVSTARMTELASLWRCRQPPADQAEDTVLPRPCCVRATERGRESATKVS